MSEFIIKEEVDSSKYKNKDISDLFCIGYPIQIKMTMQEILEIASDYLISELLGLTDISNENPSNELYNKISYNENGRNEWKMHMDSMKRFREIYYSGDNSEYEYNVFLQDLTEENLKTLPQKMQDVLKDVELVLEKPKFELPEINVKVKSKIVEKRFSEGGSLKYMGKEITFTDNYCYCDVPTKFLRGLLDYQGPLYYDAIKKEHYLGLLSKEAFIETARDIANNGLFSPIPIEISSYGIPVTNLTGEHRKMIVKLLDLDTIPCCLIYRSNNSFPHPSTAPVIRTEPNPEFIEFLNSKYNPEFIFHWTSIDNIPYYESDYAYVKMCNFFNDVKELMRNSFPNKIYTYETLPDDLKNDFFFKKEMNQ